MALPRLEKITVSCGVGKAKDNKKLLQDAVEILDRDHRPEGRDHQGPAADRAVQAARGDARRVRWSRFAATRAYEFLDRLITVVIPRIRDFRGLPRKTDAQGNYNMGIAEQSVFPEIGTDLLESPQGMNIAITIRNGENGAGVALLEEYSFPFRREEQTVG